MASPLSQKLSWELANPLWAQALNPIIANPLSSLDIIESFQLQTGVNRINHGLQRLQQGWILTDIQGIATVYRSQPFNNTTLVLTSSAQVLVNIGVF